MPAANARVDTENTLWNMSDNISNDEAEGNLQHPNSGLRNYKKSMKEKQGPSEYQHKGESKPKPRNQR